MRFLVEGKIEGLDELAAKAKKTGKFDYDAKIPGMVAVDRYTLRFRLVQNDYNFPYITAHVPSWAVAREVIEAYGDDTMAHPVGTGPYVLKSWTRGAEDRPRGQSRLPRLRLGLPPSADLWDRSWSRTMKGKKMPQIGRVEISIIEEEQSRWLAFNQKEIDYLNLPAAFRPEVFDADKELKPEWTEKGVSVYRGDRSRHHLLVLQLPRSAGRRLFAGRRSRCAARSSWPTTSTRRSASSARTRRSRPKCRFPRASSATIRRIAASTATTPRSPTSCSTTSSTRAARTATARCPTASRSSLRYASGTTAIEREFNELWKKSMDAIGIRIEFQVTKFADRLKAAKACQLMMSGLAWIADYPDGDNFMQLLYGPNTGQSNNGCYESKAFDAFYVKSTQMPDSPERNRLFLEMTRQMEVDGAWSLHVSRERNQMLWPWVQGYKKHPILHAEFVYMDLEPRR